MLSTILPGAIIGRSSKGIVNDFAKKGAGADGCIKGVVTEQGIGVIRRIMCYHRMSGALISTTLSKTSGEYYFDDLIAGVKYYITSLDESDESTQYNAVTQDLITASEVIK